MEEYKNISGNTNRKHYNCSSNTKIPFFVQNLSCCILQRGFKSIAIWSFMQLSKIIFLNNKKIFLGLVWNKVIIIIFRINFIDRWILHHVIVLNCERKVRLWVPALTDILVGIWMQKTHIVVHCVLLFNCCLC